MKINAQISQHGRKCYGCNEKILKDDKVYIISEIAHTKDFHLCQKCISEIADSLNYSNSEDKE